MTASAGECHADVVALAAVVAFVCCLIGCLKTAKPDMGHRSQREIARSEIIARASLETGCPRDQLKVRVLEVGKDALGHAIVIRALVEGCEKRLKYRNVGRRW